MFGWVGVWLGGCLDVGCWMLDVGSGWLSVGCRLGLGCLAVGWGLEVGVGWLGLGWMLDVDGCWMLGTFEF